MKIFIEIFIICFPYLAGFFATFAAWEFILYICNRPLK
jgi:hypothetical protein